ncbi:hypothetical protein GQ42DRAFT_164742 [Ramicandelaber brevisporus]|nr:hypothetical protein GQ42DRAFT_164742 [Ramicandelaber brevisporus]
MLPDSDEHGDLPSLQQQLLSLNVDDQGEVTAKLERKIAGDPGSLLQIWKGGNFDWLLSHGLEACPALQDTTIAAIQSIVNSSSCPFESHAERCEECLQMSLILYQYLPESIDVALTIIDILIMNRQALSASVVSDILCVFDGTWSDFLGLALQYDSNLNMSGYTGLLVESLHSCRELDIDFRTCISLCDLLAFSLIESASTPGMFESTICGMSVQIGTEVHQLINRQQRLFPSKIWLDLLNQQCGEQLLECIINLEDTQEFRINMAKLDLLQSLAVASYCRHSGILKKVEQLVDKIARFEELEVNTCRLALLCASLNAHMIGRMKIHHMKQEKAANRPVFLSLEQSGLCLTSSRLLAVIYKLYQHSQALGRSLDEFPSDVIDHIVICGPWALQHPFFNNDDVDFDVSRNEISAPTQREFASFVIECIASFVHWPHGNDKQRDKLFTLDVVSHYLASLLSDKTAYSLIPATAKHRLFQLACDCVLGANIMASGFGFTVLSAFIKTGDRMLFNKADQYGIDMVVIDVVTCNDFADVDTANVEDVRFASSAAVGYLNTHFRHIPPISGQADIDTHQANLQRMITRLTAALNLLCSDARSSTPKYSHLPNHVHIVEAAAILVSDRGLDTSLQLIKQFADSMLRLIQSNERCHDLVNSACLFLGKSSVINANSSLFDGADGHWFLDLIMKQWLSGGYKEHSVHFCDPLFHLFVNDNEDELEFWLEKGTDNSGILDAIKQQLWFDVGIQRRFTSGAAHYVDHYIMDPAALVLSTVHRNGFVDLLIKLLERIKVWLKAMNEWSLDELKLAHEQVTAMVSNALKLICWLLQPVSEPISFEQTDLIAALYLPRDGYFDRAIDLLGALSGLYSRALQLPSDGSEDEKLTEQLVRTCISIGTAFRRYPLLLIRCQDIESPLMLFYLDMIRAPGNFCFYSSVDLMETELGGYPVDRALAELDPVDAWLDIYDHTCDEIEVFT